jgi:hypothetical protein
MSAAEARASTDVFFNCPFDDAYGDILRAVIFAIACCAFRVRCALEIADSSLPRIERLRTIVGECRYGIHDLSRTEPDPRSGLPRFNMPFELGLFLGAKWFGNPKQRLKNCLILDSAPFRYQQFLSDIAGQDIAAHSNDPRKAIRVVRDWLRTVSGQNTTPSTAAIWSDFLVFQRELPRLAEQLRAEPEELHYADYIGIVARWLQAQADRGKLRE